VEGMSLYGVLVVFCSYLPASCLRCWCCHGPASPQPACHGWSAHV
jgi:hypothetical protein